MRAASLGFTLLELFFVSILSVVLIASVYQLTAPEGREGNVVEARKRVSEVWDAVIAYGELHTGQPDLGSGSFPALADALVHRRNFCGVKKDPSGERSAFAAGPRELLDLRLLSDRLYTTQRAAPFNGLLRSRSQSGEPQLNFAFSFAPTEAQTAGSSFTSPANFLTLDTVYRDLNTALLNTRRNSLSNLSGTADINRGVMLSSGSVQLGASTPRFTINAPFDETMIRIVSAEPYVLESHIDSEIKRIEANPLIINKVNPTNEQIQQRDWALRHIRSYCNQVGNQITLVVSHFNPPAATQRDAYLDELLVELRLHYAEAYGCGRLSIERAASTPYIYFGLATGRFRC